MTLKKGGQDGNSPLISVQKILRCLVDIGGVNCRVKGRGDPIWHRCSSWAPGLDDPSWSGSIGVRFLDCRDRGSNSVQCVRNCLEDGRVIELLERRGRGYSRDRGR